MKISRASSICFGILALSFVQVYGAGEKGTNSTQPLDDAKVLDKIEQFAEEPQQVDQAVFPMLLDALDNKSKSIREASMTVIMNAAILSKSSPDKVKGSIFAPESVGYSKLYNAVVIALKDKDIEVRALAVATIALGFPPKDETEKLLIDRFKADDSPVVRAKIIEALNLSNYKSDAVNTLLFSGLADSSAVVVIDAAKYMSRLHIDPSRAVPSLISALHRNSDHLARLAIINAIGTYGKYASKYADDLKLMKENAIEEANAIATVLQSADYSMPKTK